MAFAAAAAIAFVVIIRKCPRARSANRSRERARPGT